MSQPPCNAQVCQGSLPAADCCSKENSADNAVRRAFARVSLWRAPPHWSRRDWLDEVRAILQSAATSARFDYDEQRAVPLRAHIYIRAVAAAWSRYRQEWSYYLHSATESGAGMEPIAMPFNRSQADETIRYFLGQALSQLSVDDQGLIRQLFWDNASQRRVAIRLQISQQCVSKRKARVLRLLHRALISQSHPFSHFITACWAVLDSLDLLPLVDLL